MVERIPEEDGVVSSILTSGTLYASGLLHHLVFCFTLRPSGVEQSGSSAGS